MFSKFCGFTAKPEISVIFVTHQFGSSLYFINEFIELVRAGRGSEFRAKYRDADLLLVDDVQFVAGKEQVQNEFFHTFNTLYEAGRQIVLTSDRPPSDMHLLDDRLRTRFEWGLLVDVQPPDFETRLAIVKNKAAQWGTVIDDDIAKYIAENVTSNVRQLEGTMNKILAYRDLIGREMDADAAHRAVEDFMKKNANLAPTAAMIITETSRYFGIDEEVIKDFIRTHRRAGVRLNHMSVIISAYYKAVLRNPKLNYFVMNGRIYRRNHFCVSFVILKKQADGVVNETTLKVYLDENDTVFTVNQKIKDAIDANKAEHQSNSTDKFARFMFSVPGLPKFVVWLAYHLDKHGLLPRKIIDLSPFHTSMFITNLASIKTSYIHHHCYEFGTTSVFVCMGKPVPNYISGDLTKKMMPIGVVMDERICTGYEYAAFCNDFRRYMRLPRMLEYPFCQEEPAKEPSQETAAV